MNSGENNSSKSHVGLTVGITVGFLFGMLINIIVLPIAVGLGAVSYKKREAALANILTNAASPITELLFIDNHLHFHS